MSRSKPGDITLLLSDLKNPESLEMLTRLVYDDLGRMSAGHLRGERVGHSLQRTALVHEAWIKLMKKGSLYSNRAHFFGCASNAMRQILVEKARRHQSRKHGGHYTRVDLDQADLLGFEQPRDLMEFDSALIRLKAAQPVLAQAAELRAFGGWKFKEMAEILDIGESTARARWSAAVKWLRAYISTGIADI